MTVTVVTCINLCMTKVRNSSRLFGVDMLVGHLHVSVVDLKVNG